MWREWNRVEESGREWMRVDESGREWKRVGRAEENVCKWKRMVFRCEGMCVKGRKIEKT